MKISDEMKEFFSTTIFSLSGLDISLGQLLVVLAIVVGIVYLYRVIIRRFFPSAGPSEETQPQDNKRLKSILLSLFAFLFLVLLLAALKLDYSFYSSEKFDLNLGLILRVILFFQFARLLDWIISNIFIHNYYSKGDEAQSSKYYNRDDESKVRRTIQSIFYVVVILFILQNFNLDFKLFDRTINNEIVSFNISNIIIAVLIILIAQLIIWVMTQIVLYNVYRSKSMDAGSQYAINQLAKYIIYVIAILWAFDALGINMTLLLGGAAALLVGVGLGLQQTFNDFISGIVLLFERSVSVGDVLEFEGTVGTIRKIGLRSSMVETRDNVSLIVPNHLLVNNTVLNWTHFSDKVRFEINIGVAYGSDTALVKELLLDAVKENPYALEYPAPIVRLIEFGESSLDFRVFFFSRNYMVIEDIKSDLRIDIDSRFRAKNINIPFPQRDINIRKD